MWEQLIKRTLQSSEDYTVLIAVLAVLGTVSLVGCGCLFLRKRKFIFTNKHVVITGGSKGLGFELAKHLAVDHSAHVTICCRTQTDLSSATQQIRDQFTKQEHSGRIQGFICDVTDIEACKQMISDAERAFGNVCVLINCAGKATPGLFTDQSPQHFEDSIKLNYLGSVYPTKVFVDNIFERFRGETPEHKIVFVSSQAGLMACAGYASYSPSKYAVRGFAEALRNELFPHNIHVSIAFPGNMKTPGFEEEEKIKPVATKQIEKGEALQDPAEVARCICSSLAKHEYALYGGNMNGYFLGRMSHGLAPLGRSLVVDFVLAPFLVLAAWGHRVFVLDRCSANAAKKKE